MDPNDFISSLLFHDLDYLPVVFGMFPSKLMLSDEELLAAKQAEDQAIIERDHAVAKVAVVRDQIAKKTGFEKGQWNVNTVNGGLGAQSAFEGLALTGENSSVSVEAFHARLFQLWDKLKMSAMEKMNLAIKYSSKKFLTQVINSFHDHIDSAGPLEETIILWEGMVDAILRREECLKRLEIFERVASDPARYFVKVMLHNRDRSLTHDVV